MPDSWGDFPPEPHSWSSIAWICSIIVALTMVAILSVYVWSQAAPEETIVSRINVISTIVLAFVGVGTAGLALVSLMQARQVQIAQTRPIVFPVLSHEDDRTLLFLVNGGNGHARDLTFRISPRVEAAVGGKYMEDHFRWKNPITFLPMGGEVPLDIAPRDPQHIINRPGNQILTVYLRYRHGFTNAIYREQFDLNLDQYAYGSSKSPDGVLTSWGSRLRKT